MLRVVDPVPAPKTPKIVEVGEDGSFELPEDEPPETPATPEEQPPSLLDELMADAAAVRAEQTEKRAAASRRATKGFGDGLKKGFFAASVEKTKTPKSASSKTIPTVRARRDNDGEDVRARIRDEVAASLDDQRTPLERTLGDGKWLTEDLISKIEKNEGLRRKLGDPKYAAALEALRSGDAETRRRAVEKLDPDVAEFLTEMCGILGGHFEALGAREDEDARRRALEEKIGPLAAEVAMRAEQHRTPPTTRETRHKEQSEVDAILSNEDLRSLLMDPETQRLVQRCGDPDEFRRAMRDPAARARIARLREAGLVQVET